MVQSVTDPDEAGLWSTAARLTVAHSPARRLPLAFHRRHSWSLTPPFITGLPPMPRQRGPVRVLRSTGRRVL